MIKFYVWNSKLKTLNNSHQHTHHDVNGELTRANTTLHEAFKSLKLRPVFSIALHATSSLFAPSVELAIVSLLMLGALKMAKSDQIQRLIFW